MRFYVLTLLRKYESSAVTRISWLVLGPLLPARARAAAALSASYRTGSSRTVTASVPIVPCGKAASPLGDGAAVGAASPLRAISELDSDAVFDVLTLHLYVNAYLRISIMTPLLRQKMTLGLPHSQSAHPP